MRAEERRTLALPQCELNYHLKRSSARRTLALRVDGRGEVAVNAPLRLPLAHIEQFIRAHADWLHGRLQRARATTFVWQDGAALPWLGGSLTLRVGPPCAGGAIRREGGVLCCAVAEAELAARVLDWYRTQARVQLAPRLAVWAAVAGVPTPPLRLSNARTRWGSLSAAGVVALNWRLVMLPQRAIDYVICHELAHLRRRDHSPAFWREVERLYPDWREARQVLRSGQHHCFHVA